MNKPIIAKINDKFETLLLIIQAGALIIITIATAVAIVAEGYDMFVTKSIGLANLLLLFLFIEILSMVRQYSLGQHDDIEEENLSSLQKLSDKLSGMVGKKKDSQKDDNS